MVKSIRYFGLFLLLNCCQIAFGQKQEKLYYNKEWKGCSEAIASFYRLVTLDDNGMSIGIIRDYFISGELQCEIDEALFIDKIDDKNSKIIGKSVGYYKSGKKNFESIYDSKGVIISNVHWFENGKKKYEGLYNSGKLDGLEISYHENGQINAKKEYVLGKVVDKWYLQCDEFGKCQTIFFEGFRTNVNENDWSKIDNEEIKTEVISGQGLLMKKNTKNSFNSLIKLPIDISRNFSIETIINFKKGDKDNGQGLVYGFKDWSNYDYFYLSANGYYRIGRLSDGMILEKAQWVPSIYINKNLARNTIQINRINNKVFYSINRQIVSDDDFYALQGSNIGFAIHGKKEVVFERLTVRQDIEENESNSNSTNRSGWKGNGTGFFIDGKGYITTNYHVIMDASEIEIDLIQKGEKKSFKAKVISIDKQNDLAIIMIDDPKFKPYLKLPYSFKTKISDIGSDVFALGYPMALSTMGEEVKFTDGKISSKTGYQGDVSTYQISVPVQPGNSGGPLFDYDGNIIGIVSAKIMEADNVSYAIKSNYLKNLLDVLPENLNIPNDLSLISLSLTEKIKLLSDYVVLIKIK